MPREHHLLTQRTARYYTIGEPDSAVREVLYAFHGYGQLAGRFAARLELLARAARLVVVPEALSRFYVRASDHAAPGGRGDARPGASWMTREDREHEIADQLRYLAALHARVLQELPEARPEVSMLGFSQGAATMMRWLATGGVRPQTVVVWAGTLPAELTMARLTELLRDVRVVMVIGESDELAPAEDVAREEDRLREAGIVFERLTFDGGHVLDADTLLRIFPVVTPAVPAGDAEEAR